MMLASTLGAACGGIVLRTETDADVDFLAALYADTRAEELAPVEWPEVEKSRFLRSQFALQRQHYRAHYAGAEFLVLEQEGERIGRLYLHSGAREIRLMDIAVVRALRGRGIGSRVLAALLAHAAHAGRQVTLHVEPNNPAMHWYERMGFERVEERGACWFLAWTPRALS